MKNIFISSTFIDMQAERDLVQERVIPELRDEARKYGDNVGVIDLRWGVDTSMLETDEGSAKVLQVCLDEIDRSHPYMLIFLGERYGTVMKEEQIEKSVRGREDKYTTDDYIKSITALEVEYGALSEKYGELNHCVVCFREPVVHMLDGAEKDLYVEHTEEGKRKLEALKERIKRDLGEDDRLISYSCMWDKSARQLVNFTSNGQPLEHVLTSCFVEMFRDDWKEYENLSWQDKEQLAFRALMESKLRSFVGREALLEEYYHSAINGTCPIILRGEVGSGKTAIMCKLVERLQKEGKNVFAFFSGAGSMSTNAESLVKQMVYYMENLLGVEEHFGEKEEGKDEKGVQYDDWMEQLGELCFRLQEECIYFCIDALDQLFTDEHVEKLDFFVRGKNVRIIASCTKDFDLPAEVMVNREVKSIPGLREADAKLVADGILASYSRNAYTAIEEEILKKKSIGNPLYISLLIQRLNMMDMEELRKAMTEEEIVALGTGIIRDMPEETEDAIVAVIRNGIDKISETEDVLYETLQFLAISRNGLRMSDLQRIFTMQNKNLPVLDFTLLMKYLDGFFYVHEDDRIDFTHKVIRQGLLKGLAEREEKEEAIKEYLKILDVMDGLRMQEGMFFARIRRDEDFAKKLIEQAHRQGPAGLMKAIKNEAVKDGGEFYCGLIEKETQEKSVICQYLQWQLSGQLGLAKEEMRAKLAIGESLVICLKKLYEKTGSESSLRDLSSSCNNMGNVLQNLGQPREALAYHEKAVKSAEELYEKTGSELNLRELFLSYNGMGNVLQALDRRQEALSYHEKAVKSAEELYEKTGSESRLRDLFASCNNMGYVLRDLGQPREALPYHEKAVKSAEELYEKTGSEFSLRDLSVSYNNMGYVLQRLGQLQEARSYYEKAIKSAKELHEKTGSELSLRELSINYNNMGNALWASKQLWEALPYYEKAVKNAKELHEKTGSEASLQVLSTSYSNMRNALRALGQPQKVLQYYEKAVKSAEELYEKAESEERLRDLFTSYNNMGNAFRDFGQAQEALPYYEKAVKSAEELYEKAESESSFQVLSASYHNMGHVLKKLMQEQKALVYYEKAVKSAEELNRKTGSEESLRGLFDSCNKMGNVLRDLGQPREALPYHEKAVKSAEELYEKTGSEEDLWKLSISYKDMGSTLKDLHRLQEALSYYEKSLKCKEDLYSKTGSQMSRLELSGIYSYMGNVFQALGQLQEALSCYDKSLEYR